jgi:hypothetical protein
LSLGCWLSGSAARRAVQRHSRERLHRRPRVHFPRAAATANAVLLRSCCCCCLSGADARRSVLKGTGTAGRCARPCRGRHVAIGHGARAPAGNGLRPAIPSARCCRLLLLLLLGNAASLRTRRRMLLLRPRRGVLRAGARTRIARCSWSMPLVPVLLLLRLLLRRLLLRQRGAGTKRCVRRSRRLIVSRCWRRCCRRLTRITLLRAAAAAAKRGRNARRIAVEASAGAASAGRSRCGAGGAWSCCQRLHSRTRAYARMNEHQLQELRIRADLRKGAGGGFRSGGRLGVKGAAAGPSRSWLASCTTRQQRAE